jgi:hypothetical protein
MIFQNFAHYLAPLLIMIVVWIIAYVGLKKASIPGNNATHSILAFLISLILVSSKKVTSYLSNLIPFLIVIMTLSFIIVLILAFTSKDVKLAKPLTWIGFALAIVLCVASAFNQFPTLNHMLPGTSDGHLSSELEDFKDFIYSSPFTDNFLFIASIVLVFLVILKTK